MIKKILIVFLLAYIISGCGEGISPEAEIVQTKTGFGGKITFKGNWPPGITRTHVVAFRKLIESAGDFNILNLGFVSDSIPYNTKSINYSSLKEPFIEIGPGNYSYIVVAQSKTPLISLERINWFVVGVYYAENDSVNPGKLVVKEDEFTDNINIICDFDNPPPQPPGGN